MKALILYNPYSGYQKTKNIIPYIQRKLLTKYNVVDIFSSNEKGNLSIKTINDASNYDTLVICGGDGTLNEIVNALMQLSKRPVIAYIPCGTVNDVGKNLGLSRNKIHNSLNIILNGNVVDMDICKIENKYFLYAQAIGKFTSISYKASSKLKKKIGKNAYFLEAIKHLTDDSTIDLTVNANNEIVSGKFFVLLTLNTQRVAGFKFYRNKSVKLNDGLIDMTLIKSQKAFNILNLILFFLFGDRIKRGVKTITSNKFHLRTEQILPYNIDGEHAFDSNEVVIEVVPCAIKIIVCDKTKKALF